MTTSRWLMSAATTIGLLLSGCESGDGGKLDGVLANVAGKGQIRTVKGTLGGLDGKKVAIAAKTSGGKVVKAVIDPKSKSFSLNVPKGQSAVLTVQAGGKTKKVKFLRNGTQALEQAGGADAGSEQNDDYAIPDDDFEGDADLGELDFEDGEEIVCGDEEGEHSVYEYIDGDNDGDFDFADFDDDGDGTPDFSDEDFEQLLAWLEEAWGEDGWYEEDDFCDLDLEAAGLCSPGDEDFFSEEECGEEGAEDWCYGEDEEGYYETSDEDDWWCSCEGEGADENSDSEEGDEADEGEFDGGDEDAWSDDEDSDDEDYYYEGDEDQDYSDGGESYADSAGDDGCVAECAAWCEGDAECVSYCPEMCAS